MTVAFKNRKLRIVCFTEKKDNFLSLSAVVATTEIVFKVNYFGHYEVIWPRQYYDFRLTALSTNLTAFVLPEIFSCFVEQVQIWFQAQNLVVHYHSKQYCQFSEHKNIEHMKVSKIILKVRNISSIHCTTNRIVQVILLFWDLVDVPRQFSLYVVRSCFLMSTIDWLDYILKTANNVGRS